MTLLLPVYTEINRLLFGPETVEEDVRRWWNAGFVFVEPGVPVPGSADLFTLGLQQTSGGPCSVLAVVQGLMILNRAYSADFAKDSDAIPAAASNEQLFGGVNSAEDRDGVLCSALACVLWTAASTAKQASDPTGSIVILSCDPSTLTPGDPLQPDAISVLEATSYDEAQALLLSVKQHYASPAGVMLLVMSCILSRGVETVRADFDEPDVSLVGRFGHAGTEMLNLLLCGSATSGVFDGEQVLGEGQDTLKLKGVSRRPRIGFLTHAEAARYMEVGTLLKTPVYPAWIIAGESHYSLLWAESSAALELSPSAKAYAVWKQYDETGAGMISESHLSAVLDGVGIPPSAHASIRAAVNDGGVVLWTALWPKIASQLGLKPVEQSSTDARSVQAVTPPGGGGRGSPDPSMSNSLAQDLPQDVDPDVVTAVVQGMCMDHGLSVSDGACIHVQALMGESGVLAQAQGTLGIHLASALQGAAAVGVSSEDGWATQLPRASVHPVHGLLPDADDYVVVEVLTAALSVAIKAALEGQARRREGGASHAVAAPRPRVPSAQDEVRSTGSGKRPRSDSAMALALMEEEVHRQDGGGGAGGRRGSGDAVVGDEEILPLEPVPDVIVSTDQRPGGVDWAAVTAAGLRPSLASPLAAMGPYTTERIFTVWHYNGLVDGGRQPVLSQLRLQQRDTGALPGSSLNDASSLLALQQQWAVPGGGGIQEQMAAAVALSMQAVEGTGAGGSTGSASSLHAQMRDVPALEGILRTRWTGATIQAVQGGIGPRLH